MATKESRDFQNFAAIIALQQLQAEDLARVAKQVRNVLSEWEQLPNGYKTEPDLNNLSVAIDGIRGVRFSVEDFIVTL